MIKVNVVCENETKQVMINELSTPIDLIKLLFNFDEKIQYLPLPLFQGRILDPNLTFKFQNVQNDDTIVLYQNQEISKENYYYELQNSSNLPITSFDHKIKTILNEAVKVKDKKFNHFELNPKRFRALQKLVLTETPNIEFQELTSPTIIPPKADAPSLQPLNVDFTSFQEDQNEEDSDSSFEEDNDDDSNFSLMFESIEEAGKFIRKHNYPQWSW